MPKFYTQFNHGKVEPFKCSTPSMTEQQFAFETNINNIVSGQANFILPSYTAEALYGLTLTGEEYQTMLNSVAEVKNYFEELPVKAKEYFDYEPNKMIDFFKDEKNYEKAYDLGLIDKSAYFNKKDAFAKKQKEVTQNAPSEVTSSPAEVTVNSQQ